MKKTSNLEPKDIALKAFFKYAMLFTVLYGLGIGNLYAQATPPAGTPYITLTTTPNATIQINLEASAPNTPVWIETAPNTYTQITVGTWTSTTFYTVAGTTLKVHGNLAGLNCSSNQLNSLDVSQNTALKYLNCSSNQLSNLDVSNNTDLIYLKCAYNQLSSLDVSQNTALQDLICYKNQLSSLDVSMLDSLEYLHCTYNQLSSLDVSQNTALERLACKYNQLSSLDVSQNTALDVLHCTSNQLSSLDVSQNTALTHLICDANQLSSLDVSNNTALIYLKCTYNQLVYLNVANGNNSNINTMHANDNPNLTCIQHDTGFNPTTWQKDASAHWSTSPCPPPTGTPYIEVTTTPNATIQIDLMASTANTPVWIETAPGTYTQTTVGTSWIGYTDYTVAGTMLKVHGNLTKFDCYNNATKVTDLDVSNHTALEWLYCSNNQLSSLDVSMLDSLKELYCSSNQLSSLDVSNNTALEYLYCSSNQLNSLDVSQNTALEYLKCLDNQLSSLDVSNNTALRNLDCKYNQLSSLDVSQNTALAYLYCNDNQLVHLNVANSNNSNMTIMKAKNNPNLTCIQHDTGFDPTTTSHTWEKDVTASWSTSPCPPPTGTPYIEVTTTPNATIQINLSAGAPNTPVWIETAPNVYMHTTVGTSWTNFIDYTVAGTTLKVHGNITKFDCRNNTTKLTGLDVNNHTALEFLELYNNIVINLDVSNNIALTHLGCKANELSNLDVSNNTALEWFSCSKNRINSLDVSNNTALRKLWCYDNQLVYLNVANGNNSNMTIMKAKNNPNLTCIQHDTGFNPTTNTDWEKDGSASWSTNCLVLVSSINVQGQGGDSTITTNGGTLQMEATVLPSNATDGTYTWSRANGTGSATISSTGLLTAVANGTVTVTATANDASGTTGSATITISNQGVGINDVAFEGLKIYPNPAKDILYIEAQEKLEQIQLIDVSGKIVKTFNAESKQFNIANIAKGIYFIKISNAAKQSIQKVVIK